MNNSDERIECPFCGCRTVTATVVATFYCKKERPVYKDGIKIDGNSIWETYGYMSEPSLSCSSFFALLARKGGIRFSMSLL